MNTNEENTLTPPLMPPHRPNALEAQPEDAAAEEKPVRKNNNRFLNYVLEAEKKTQTAQAGPVPHKTAQPPAGAPQGPCAADEDNAASGQDQPQAKSQAPKNWTDEDKKAFSTLPEDGRQILLNIHKNMLSGLNRQMQKASVYRQELGAVVDGLAPVVQGRFESFGDFVQYVKSMQSFEAELKRNPRRTLAVLAEQAGVELADLAAYRPNPTEEALLPLQAQIAQLKSELLGRQDGREQPSAPQDENDPIAQFANATDEAGKLKYPHFEKVAQLMGAIMQRDGHEDLAKAYAEAVNVLPEVREQTLAAQKEAWLREQRARADVEKAKRAGALKTRSTAGLAAPANGRKKRPLDYILEAEQRLANK